MRIEIRADDVAMDERTRKKIRHRAERALERFERDLTTVEIVVSDENGPRGGIDKRVVATVRPRGRDPLVIEARGAHVLGTVGGALRRVQRALTRWKSRRRDAARRPVITPAPETASRPRAENGEEA